MECRRRRKERKRDRTHLLDRGDVSGRNRSSHDPRLEGDVGTELSIELHRLDESLNLSVLSGSSSLLLVRVLELGGLGDRLPESDSRLSGLALDSVLSLQSFDVDLEVELSHSGDDGLRESERSEKVSTSRREEEKRRDEFVEARDDEEEGRE